MTPDRNPILSYDAEHRLRTLLAGAALTDGLQAPPQVERALVAALRRRHRRMMAGRIALASALAAAVLLGLHLTRPVEPRVPSPVSANVRETFASDPLPTVAAPPPVVAKTAKRQRIRRSAPKPAEQKLAVREQNDFIPVGPWQAMEPMERGSIIRVRLPKSSLPGFGIPVSADRWNESIPADIVLGEDGTMRAVRFINTRQ
jgi:hypothetical protein